MRKFLYLVCFLLFHNFVYSQPANEKLHEAQTNYRSGEYVKAEKLCKIALEKNSDDPDFLTLLGHIYKETGRYDLAKTSYLEAFEKNSNHLQSRLNYGKMQWEWGEKKAARETLNFFISYYRNNRNLTGEELGAVAEACIYLDRFRDANSLFNDATTSDVGLWQPYVPWGNLMLSKYNVPDAQAIFGDALEINPKSAEAHLGMAKIFLHSSFDAAREAVKTALEINPKMVPALDYLAEMHIMAGNFEDALKELDAPLEVNPNSLTTRTLRALCFYFLKKEGDFKKAEQKILAINPKYGELYYQIAEVLSKRYLFTESIDFYQKAIALDIENWPAYSGMGTSLSRIGKESAAKKTLEIAFDKDPYNKHVGNLLTLFDELPEYKTYKTKHLTLRIHPDDDAVLSHYAKKLADESFDSLLEKYPIDTNEEIILEIFPSHDDFAVRCFGLPGAQAFLGICFGNLVAMDSPRARSAGDFVWGETLWHELVHVTHLRLTANRVPRWLAEGIAVYEATAANPHWSMNLDLPFILAFKADKTLPLKDLDSGFSRPTNPGQVSLSYFQASLIVEFIVEKYGHNKLAAMFPFFKKGLTTTDAIESVFDKDIEVFDNEFQDHVKKKYRFDSVDYTVKSQNSADQMDDLDEEEVVNSNNPFQNFRLGLKFKSENDFDNAIHYLKQAKLLFPGFVEHENPYSQLAEIYLETGNLAEAIRELEILTSLNGKRLAPLKKLADLCLDAKNYEAAITALEKMIFIAPFESDTHMKLAQAYTAIKQYNLAVNELKINLHTQPQDLAGAHCDLADVLLKSGNKTEAKKSALASLEIAPDYERAQEILLAAIK